MSLEARKAGRSHAADRARHRRSLRCETSRDEGVALSLVAKAAEWANTGEVQLSFSKAKVPGGERVRFDVAGGDYRMIVAFDVRRGIAFIKFIGTHAEYDRVDALTVSRF